MQMLRPVIGGHFFNCQMVKCNSALLLSFHKNDAAYQQISFYDSKATQTLVMPQPDIHSLISLHQIGEEVSIPHYRVTAVRELAGQRVEVTVLRYHHRFKAIDAPLHAAPEVISESKQQMRRSLLSLVFHTRR